MTNDERISSYIDNEFSAEQEQEFLISLAASDGLRKSFRSELVLKKVVHTDEMLTNPPREMRAAVFAAIGLGTAAAVTAGKASVAHASASAPAHGIIKGLFATKMSTLITAAGLSVSALAGYGVHSLVTPSEASHSSNPVTHTAAPQLSPSGPAVQNVAPTQTFATPATQPVAIAKKHHRSSVILKKAEPTVVAPPEGQVSGGGSIDMAPPKINKSK